MNKIYLCIVKHQSARKRYALGFLFFLSVRHWLFNRFIYLYCT